MERIHFKITHAGVTRRFAISRNEGDLLSELKIRVEKITGSANLPLFWKDEDSLIVLECEEDMHAAVDYAETKNKLACVTLETGVEEAKSDDDASKITVEVVTLAQSTAAFAGYPVACDGCNVYLAASNGGRYKCMVCDNYDLCAACFAKGDHYNHAFAFLRDAETKLRISVDGLVKRTALKYTPDCNPTFVVVMDTKGAEVTKQEEQKIMKNKQEETMNQNDKEEEKLEYSRNEMMQINEEMNDGTAAAKKTGETDARKQPSLSPTNAFMAALQSKVAIAKKEFQLPAGAKMCSNPDLEWRWRNADRTHQQSQPPVEKQQVPLQNVLQDKTEDANQVKESLKLGFEQLAQHHQRPQEKQQQLSRDPTELQPAAQTANPEDPLHSGHWPIYSRTAPKPSSTTVLASGWDPVQIPPIVQKAVHRPANSDWTQLPNPKPLVYKPIPGFASSSQSSISSETKVTGAYDSMLIPPHRARNPSNPSTPGFPIAPKPSFMNDDVYMSQKAHAERLQAQLRGQMPRLNDDDGFVDDKPNWRNDPYGDYFDRMNRSRYENPQRSVGAPGDRRRCDRSFMEQQRRDLKLWERSRTQPQEQRKINEKALKHFENVCAQEQQKLMENGLHKDANEKAYRIASQIPAHMAIRVIEAMMQWLKECDLGMEEVVDYISHYIDKVEENMWALKPHPRIFPEVSVGYEDELIANIAVDLVSHLKQIRKVARNDKIHSRCPLLIDLRLDELRRALGQLGTNTGEYSGITEKLRHILLTSVYSGGKTKGNWNEKAVGFMHSDTRRDFLEPPRVASANPEIDGLIAPRPKDSIPLAAFPAVMEAMKKGFRLDKKGRTMLRKLTEANVPKDFEKMVEICRHPIEITDAIKYMRR